MAYWPKHYVLTCNCFFLICNFNFHIHQCYSIKSLVNRGAHTLSMMDHVFAGCMQPGFTPSEMNSYRKKTQDATVYQNFIIPYFK